MIPDKISEVINLLNFTFPFQKKSRNSAINSTRYATYNSFNCTKCQSVFHYLIAALTIRKPFFTWCNLLLTAEHVLCILSTTPVVRNYDEYDWCTFDSLLNLIQSAQVYHTPLGFPLFTELEKRMTMRRCKIVKFYHWLAILRRLAPLKMSRSSEDAVRAEEIHDLLEIFSKSSYKAKGDPRVRNGQVSWPGIIPVSPQSTSMLYDTLYVSGDQKEKKDWI